MDKTMKALRIKAEEYYGEGGKTKRDFVKIYKKLKMKWISGIEVEGETVDGWFSSDNSVYLLKLPEEGGYKRFKGNCIELINFLESKGGKEFVTSEKGEHINYDNTLDLKKVEDRIYGEYANLCIKTWKERKEEYLNNLPKYGIIWTEKSQTIIDKWKKGRDIESNEKKGKSEFIMESV